MTDAEPFTLRREPAPRRPEAKPLAIVATRQTALFDPGRNDLPGQAIMFPDIRIQGDTDNRCPCGGVLKRYDGAMGYEAEVCMDCGEHWSDFNPQAHAGHLRQYAAGLRRT